MIGPAMCELVEAHQALVFALARQQRYRLGGDIDELVGDGMLALVEAAQRFDPSMSVPFQAFARIRVRGAMVDGYRKRHRTGHTHGKGERPVVVSIDAGEFLLHDYSVPSAERDALDAVAHAAMVRQVAALPPHLQETVNFILTDTKPTNPKKTTEWRMKTLRRMTVTEEGGLSFLPWRGPGSGDNRRSRIDGRFVKGAA